jgi:hypothetical protein
MPDSLYRRLGLWAIDRNSNISELAVEILNRHVPEWDFKKRS